MLKDLIKTFKISKSLASQSVARLVRHGFICKSRSTCDSRNIILSKTKKLELLESKIKQIEIDYFFKAIGNLPREDSIALANLLQSLQINLEKELVLSNLSKKSLYISHLRRFSFRLFWPRRSNHPRKRALQEFPSQFAMRPRNMNLRSIDTRAGQSLFHRLTSLREFPPTSQKSVSKTAILSRRASFCMSLTTRATTPQ